MNPLGECFFNTPLEKLTQSLAQHYSGRGESEAIARLTAQGARIVELPENYDPVLDTIEDTASWLDRADYLITYHGTSSVFEATIRKRGLLPSSSTGIRNFSDSHPNSIYIGQLSHFQSIFGSVKNHAFNAAEKWGGAPLLVRAIVPVEALRPDDDWGEETGVLSYVRGGSARIDGGCDLVFPYREDPRADVDFYYGTRTAGITFTIINYRREND